MQLVCTQRQEDKEKGSGIDKVINAALLRHKKLGHPICVSRNGKIIWIPPEEIDVDIKQ